MLIPLFAEWQLSYVWCLLEPLGWNLYGTSLCSPAGLGEGVTHLGERREETYGSNCCGSPQHRDLGASVFPAWASPLPARLGASCSQGALHLISH